MYSLVIFVALSNVVVVKLLRASETRIFFSSSDGSIKEPKVSAS